MRVNPYNLMPDIGMGFDIQDRILMVSGRADNHHGTSCARCVLHAYTTAWGAGEASRGGLDPS
jgi:hypothetical protein